EQVRIPVRRVRLAVLLDRGRVIRRCECARCGRTAQRDHDEGPQLHACDSTRRKSLIKSKTSSGKLAAGPGLKDARFWGTRFPSSMTGGVCYVAGPMMTRSLALLSTGLLVSLLAACGGSSDNGNCGDGHVTGSEQCDDGN